MSAALTNAQKRQLSQMSERAYRRQAAIARGRGEDWDMSTRAISEWRHQQVAAACGKLGLRCCSQDDFGDIKGHFHHLLGEDGRALNAIVHGDPEANRRRQVEWLIVSKLEALGKSAAYAAGICKRMFRGLHLADASSDQLTKILKCLNYKIK